MCFSSHAFLIHSLFVKVSVLIEAITNFHSHVMIFRFLNRLREGANKEILGIIVSYKVKVKLVVSRGGYAQTLY